jgi:hypothetical protein
MFAHYARRLIAIIEFGAWNAQENANREIFHIRNTETLKGKKDTTVGLRGWPPTVLKTDVVKGENMKPITIRYRGKNQKLMSVKADYCHGEIPAYSNTFYWIFELDKKEVARVAESRIVKEDREKATLLYGRPWLLKIENIPNIRLVEGDIFDYNLPDEAERIWNIAGLSEREYWVIECSDRAVLHVMNNPERVVNWNPTTTMRSASFPRALKKLFPGKKIHISFSVTRTEEI